RFDRVHLLQRSIFVEDDLFQQLPFRCPVDDSGSALGSVPGLKRDDVRNGGALRVFMRVVLTNLFDSYEGEDALTRRTLGADADDTTHSRMASGQKSEEDPLHVRESILRNDSTEGDLVRAGTGADDRWRGFCRCGTSVRIRDSHCPVAPH